MKNAKPVPPTPEIKPSEPAPQEKKRESEGKIDSLKALEQRITKEDMMEVVEAVKSQSDVLETRLSFSVHEENKQIVVRVVDKASNRLIRQFPSEEFLALQDSMKDLTGMLLSENI